MRFRSTCVALFLPLTVLFSGCGSSAPADTTAAAAISGAFNDADVVFAQSMIPHHQQAVEMANLALDSDRKASAPVKELAKKIQRAQQPEIDVMTTWLTSWGKPIEMDHSSMDHGAMEGMMSADEMASLEKATESPFDTVWLTMMIRHHEGAVTMSKTVAGKGESPEVQTLAASIISAQEAEIAEMKTMLAP